MFTHFVYAIYYKNKPIYVGISANPANRLTFHVRDYRFQKLGIRYLYDVVIKIIDTIKTGSMRKCVKCYAFEQRYINMFLKKKHRLLNKLVIHYS